MLDPDAVYEIHVDNDGDAKEDITFQFRFKNTPKNISLNIGGKNVAVPLVNVGPIGPDASDTSALNVIESYTVTMIRGDRRTGTATTITNASTGDATFIKPADRIGDKSFVGPYASYADQHIYPVNIPGCAAGGQGVRRAAPRRIRRQPRGDVRSGQRQPARRARLQDQQPRGQERDHARARRAGQLPHACQSADHRRLDDDECAQTRGRRRTTTAEDDGKARDVRPVSSSRCRVSAIRW